jgi:hypothetical protein
MIEGYDLWFILNFKKLKKHEGAPAYNFALAETKRDLPKLKEK